MTLRDISQPPTQKQLIAAAIYRSCDMGRWSHGGQVIFSRVSDGFCSPLDTLEKITHC